MDFFHGEIDGFRVSRCSKQNNHPLTMGLHTQTLLFGGCIATPLKNMSSSIGMMIIETQYEYGKINLGWWQKPNMNMGKCQLDGNHSPPTRQVSGSGMISRKFRLSHWPQTLFTSPFQSTGYTRSGVHNDYSWLEINSEKSSNVKKTLETLNGWVSSRFYNHLQSSASSNVLDFP